MNLSKFERYPLTFGPTAIEYLPRLSAALGDKVEIFAKRDDCNSGLALGGNKLRKMEYLVPETDYPQQVPDYTQVICVTAILFYFNVYTFTCTVVYTFTTVL